MFLYVVWPLRFQIQSIDKFKIKVVYVFSPGARLRGCGCGSGCGNCAAVACVAVLRFFAFLQTWVGSG